MSQEWQKGVKKEMRQIDRDIQALDREERKHIAECKKLAGRDKKAMLITAKSIVQSRRAKEQMYTTRAHMNAMQMQLASQASMLKVAGAVGKSSEVMKSLNALMKVGELSAQMREFAREMEKAGLVEEMVGEALEEAMGGDEVEAEAEGEVTKILMEVVPDMPDAPWQQAKSTAAREDAAPAAAVPGNAQDETDAEMAALQARAEAL